MKKNNIDDLVLKFKEIHKDKYNYSKSKYLNNRTKIEIICKEHGSFWQSPYSHSKGHGCPYCSKNKKMNNDEFIEKAKLVHGDLYSYERINYKNNSTPIEVICKEHGVFKQTPGKHLIGRGCSDCGGSIALTNDEFERKAKLVHGELYSYEKVNYKNSRTKVDIICKEHGIFSQKPNNHLSGYGCLICRSSKGEIKIFNHLNERKIEFIQEYYLSNINQYLDFYIPSLNIAIEYDVIQHFKPIDFFGGKLALEKTKNRDRIKNIHCEENNIKLFRISYLNHDKIGSILNKIIKENIYELKSDISIDNLL